MRKCRKGLHELTPENTYGKRSCRACRKKRNRRAYNKRTTGHITEGGRIVGLGTCLICGCEWRQDQIVTDPDKPSRRYCWNCLHESILEQGLPDLTNGTPIE